MKEEKITFWGVELNEEELRSHRLSYYTVSKQFNAVLCNNIPEVDPSIFDNIESGDFYLYYDAYGNELDRNEWEEKKEQIEEVISDLEDQEWETERQERIALNHIEELKKELDDFEECPQEIYQYYIVGDSALWYLQKMGELVFYSELLDVYVWGVCHWGTSWDYVMTRIKLSDDYTRIIDDEE